MKIEFSVLSILSMALVLCLCVCGGIPSFDSISIDADILGGKLLLKVHPIIRIDADSETISRMVSNDTMGFALGNVIMINSDIQDPYTRELVLEHERNHLKQWQGIGLIKPLVNGLFNMEGQDGNVETNWTDSTIYRNSTMWTPPTWWPYKWSFMTISLNMED